MKCLHITPHSSLGIPSATFPTGRVSPAALTGAPCALGHGHTMVLMSEPRGPGWLWKVAWAGCCGPDRGSRARCCQVLWGTWPLTRGHVYMTRFSKACRSTQAGHGMKAFVPLTLLHVKITFSF